MGTVSISYRRQRGTPILGLSGPVSIVADIVSWPKGVSVRGRGSRTGPSPACASACEQDRDVLAQHRGPGRDRGPDLLEDSGASRDQRVRASRIVRSSAGCRRRGSIRPARSARRGRGQRRDVHDFIRADINRSNSRGWLRALGGLVARCCSVHGDEVLNKRTIAGVQLSTTRYGSAFHFDYRFDTFRCISDYGVPPIGSSNVEGGLQLDRPLRNAPAATSAARSWHASMGVDPARAPTGSPWRFIQIEYYSPTATHASWSRRRSAIELDPGRHRRGAGPEPPTVT